MTVFNVFSIQEVFKSQRDENVIISPISVKILMTVLAEIAGQGVQSTTRDELMLVLPGNQTLEGAREYFQEVLLSLEVRFKNEH